MVEDPYLLFKIIAGGIASALLAAGFAILFKQYLQKHYRPSLYLALAWLGFFLEALLDTVSLIFRANNQPSAFFLKLSYLCLAPGFLGVLALVDSISRDSIETKRFATLVFLLGINTIVLFMPFEEMVLNISYYMVIGIGAFISTYTLALYIKIYRSVPVGLKRAAILNVLGSFLVSVLYVILNVLEATNPGIFPPISRFFEATGALIQTLVFAKHEQLFYVLPFKTQRLIAYDTRKGISLFVHDWSKQGQIIDEDLFAGIIQGMSMIVNESIQKGHVQEIKMERGVLLISHDNIHPIAFVIIASKSSQVLNEGLAAFRRKFVQRFESKLGEGGKTGNFETASDLVTECFPFIPQFA
jgi:hypothetical protein